MANRPSHISPLHGPSAPRTPVGAEANERVRLRTLLVSAAPGGVLAVLPALEGPLSRRLALTRVRDVQAAMSELEHRPPEVILLDLDHTGEHAGAQALAELRLVAPEIPVVVICAAHHSARARSALEAGAREHLVREHVNGELIYRTLRYTVRLARLERALRTSEAHARLLYRDSPIMFLTVGPDARVRSLTRYAADQLGYQPQEMVGRSVLHYVHERHRDMTLSWLKACFAHPADIHRAEICMVRRDGGALWTRQTARLVKGETGARLACVCEDITEARALSEQLTYQASHDALTGLVNRREFEARLERVLETTRATGSEHALCYLDLDQFKVINDTCGHVAGDELLRQLGELLGARVRTRDTLARLGGDEFGVLMEHCPLERAREVADGLRHAIEDFRFAWEDKNFSIGVSIGLVPIDAASEGTTAVLSAADAACYAAKDRGRNRIHVYHAGDVEVARRHGEMQWVARIQRALEDERFELDVQPIVPVEDFHAHGAEEEFRHYELLLRMRDEEGGIVRPDAFLPAAERYDLAHHLDRWVVDTALDWLTRHPDHLSRLYLCSINVSARSVIDENFLGYVIGGFDRTEIPPEKICFEITETAAIANLASATRFIKALKEWGCRFALDDFGSGLSSFAYLKNLPVDFLKIDGVFVRGIVDDPVDLAMVKSINEIGQAFGKKTIAEFVEDRAILSKLRLRYIGVDYAQGHGVGRPQQLSRLARRFAR